MMFRTLRPHDAAKFASYVDRRTYLSGQFDKNQTGNHCEMNNDFPCRGGISTMIRPPPCAMTVAIKCEINMR